MQCACAHNIKKIAAEKGLKVEGKVIDLINKLSLEYLHSIAMDANKICEDGAKKMLNPQHIIDALKFKKFNSHIDSLKCDLKLVETNDTETNMKNEMNKVEDKTEKLLGDMIKKKRPKKEKKQKLEITQELIDLQNKLLNENKLKSDIGLITNNIIPKFAPNQDQFNNEEENYD